MHWCITTHCRPQPETGLAPKFSQWRGVVGSPISAFSSSSSSISQFCLLSRSHPKLQTWYEKIRAVSKIAAYLDWLCIHATPAWQSASVTSENTKLCTLSLGQSPMKMLYFTETSFLGCLGTLQRWNYGLMSPQSPHFAMYLQGCWLIANRLSFGMDQLFHRDHSQSVSPGTWKFGEKSSFL